MNPPELRDIHLPEASLWWPPAPGWWLLLVLLLIGLWLLPRIWRRLRQRPLRACAIDEFDAIRRAWGDEGDVHATLNRIAGLLRRILISYRGRAGHVASTGDDWRAQLEALARPGAFTPEQLQLLTRDRYRVRVEADIDDLLRACESWIRALPREADRVPV